MKVLSIFGTRPEAIKMAPVVRELRQRAETPPPVDGGTEGGHLQSLVCVTAQHRQMLDQVLGLFAIRPDIDLNLMEEDQSPASLTARAMTALTEVLEQVRPDLVLVHRAVGSRIGEKGRKGRRERRGYVCVGRVTPFPLLYLSTFFLHCTLEAEMSEKLELTLEEIEARYAGEWVLVEETAWDERGNPTRGVVIAHGFKRQVLVDPTRSLHAQKPEARTFSFYAGPKVPEDLVVVLL